MNGFADFDINKKLSQIIINFTHLFHNESCCACYFQDLTRQLQQVRRKLENYEVTSNGDKDTISLGSRTSSNGSLNTVGLPEQSSSGSVAVHTPSVVVHNQPVQHVRQPSPEQVSMLFCN